jgi:hypothetical protein
LAQVRALGGAIYRAVGELNRPAETRGVVISIPEAYRARISMGERSGLRNGARLEYLVNGQPVAYGTVTNAGLGESVATVAPKRLSPTFTSTWKYVTSATQYLRVHGSAPTKTTRSIPSF